MRNVVILLVFASGCAGGSGASGDSPDAAAERAASKLAGRDYAGALAEADAVLERRPFEATMHHVRGMALCGLDRFDEAVVALVRAAERKGDDASYWADLASAALRAKDLERARSAADRACELDPGNAGYAALRRQAADARKRD